MEAGFKTRIIGRSTDIMSHGIVAKCFIPHGFIRGSDGIQNASTDTNPSLSGCRKSNCKEMMQDLNGRLGGFIVKVHEMELHNELLEKEIQQIRAKPSLEEHYGAELRRLRELVLDGSHQKNQMEIGHHNLEQELSGLRRRFTQESQSRSNAERTMQVLEKDISEAFQVKLQLDKKAQCLSEEIDFLKKHKEADVSEILNKIPRSFEEEVSTHRLIHQDVTVALHDIRAELEGHTGRIQHVGHSLPSQFAKLTEAAKTKGEMLRSTQQQIQAYRRQVQAMDVELESAKATREALEKQLEEVEDRHMEEVFHYRNAVKELENEGMSCNFDLSGHLREYQDLLNVKMALDVEILSYRNLLCSEEARLSSMSDNSISLPFIYHQSPIYALPSSQTGGARRRLEPHYKFVEEIITETTREIEMSEFEETGSETEEGQDKEKWIKRDGGLNIDAGMDNKDSREEEGHQISKSMQEEAAFVPIEGSLVKEDGKKREEFVG